MFWGSLDFFHVLLVVVLYCAPCCVLVVFPYWLWCSLVLLRCILYAFFSVICCPRCSFLLSLVFLGTLCCCMLSFGAIFVVPCCFSLYLWHTFLLTLVFLSVLSSYLWCFSVYFGTLCLLSILFFVALGTLFYHFWCSLVHLAAHIDAPRLFYAISIVHSPYCFFVASGAFYTFLWCFLAYFGTRGLVSLLLLHPLVVSSIIFVVPLCVFLLSLLFFGALSCYL